MKLTNPAPQFTDPSVQVAPRLPTIVAVHVPDPWESSSVTENWASPGPSHSRPPFVQPPWIVTAGVWLVPVEVTEAVAEAQPSDAATEATFAPTPATLQVVVAPVPEAQPLHVSVTGSPSGSAALALTVVVHDGWHEPPPLVLTAGGAFVPSMVTDAVADEPRPSATVTVAVFDPGLATVQVDVGDEPPAQPCQV